MDAQGALRTAWLPEQNLLYYPDEYVQSTERHPMDHLSGVLRDRKFGKSRIGLEMDNYYFSARRMNSISSSDFTALHQFTSPVASSKDALGRCFSREVYAAAEK